MHWLSWLTAKDAGLIRDRLANTAVAQVRARHWGTDAKGASPGGIPRMYILDLRGLLLVAGVLRYTLNQFDTLVLYRGQRKDWTLQMSLLRGVSQRRSADDRCAWLMRALDVISPVFDRTGSPDEREALAQHYGFRTRWLDVVDNVQTAAWFAYHDAEMAQAGSGRHDEAVGYIQVVAAPKNHPGVAWAYDLRSKPSDWLRPHIQQAWGIRTAHPERTFGKVPHLHVATFIVPRPLLRLWSGYDVFTPEVFFPNREEDLGLDLWQRAYGLLERAGLVPFPWSERLLPVDSGERQKSALTKTGKGQPIDS